MQNPDEQNGNVYSEVLRFEKPPVGLCYVDTDLKYVAVNDWLAARNGVSPEDHVGRRVGEVHPGTATRLEAQLRQVIDTGEPIINGLDYRETANRTDKMRLYLHDYYADKADDETVLGVKCVTRDVTQHRQVEVKGVVPWEADAGTRDFSYVGIQAEEMFGYPIQRWYETGFWAAHIHPDDRESTLNLLSKSCRTLENCVLDYRIIKADGGTAWIRDLADVESVAGRPIILRGLMFDISDLKKGQERIERDRAALRESLAAVEGLKRQLRVQNVGLEDEIQPAKVSDGMVGESDQMLHLGMLISQVAPTETTVLILGETGTGKELIAQRVQAQSRRINGAFVRVNCATLPAALIESELFGHERGAFTGAIRQRIGRFELADGGTIFLDEIGELPLELQPKLLRVLQEGQFERLGSTKTIKTDVRVIAATNRDLEEAVASGQFREDLYYRLQVFPINAPPLRGRSADIRLLVWHFLNHFNARVGRLIESVPGEVMDRLTGYAWPGNVRELRNVIERAVVLTVGTSLQLEASFGLRGPSLHAHVRRTDHGLVGRTDPGDVATPETLDAQCNRLEQVERAHVVKVLEKCGWRIKGNSGAAELLGLQPSTLTSRLKKLGIERPRKTV